MDLRHLRYYKEIIDQGSISKAARALNIAQPPLSQLLKRLESELGTTLIHRNRKKWEVTEAGKLLYEYAESVLNQTKEVKRQIHEIEEGEAGTVRIGVAPACINILIDYIVQFRKKYPQIKIHTFTGYKKILLYKLKQKELDLAFLFNPGQSETFEIKPFKKEKAVLIVPRNWKDRLSVNPTVEEIAELPFIMLGDLDDHPLSEKILSFFGKHGVKPNIVFQCMDIQVVIALVNRGLGISIIPRLHYPSGYFERFNIFEYDDFDLQIEPVALKMAASPLSKAGAKFWSMI